MQLLYMLSLHPPLVCLLCACSDLISSQHRQGQDRERRNTRGTSVVIAIAKSSPPPKAANNKAPIAKGSQHYPKTYLSVSFIHPRVAETSSLSLQPNSSARRVSSFAFKRSCSSFSAFSLNSSEKHDSSSACSFAYALLLSAVLPQCDITLLPIQ